MRKRMKSALYNEFTIVDKYELSRTRAFVVEGGYLLHAATWKKNACNTYYIYIQCVNYLKAISCQQKYTYSVIR